MTFRVGQVGEEQEYEIAGTSYLGRPVTVTGQGNDAEVRGLLADALNELDDVQVEPYLPVGGLPYAPAAILKANAYPAQIAMGPGGCTNPSFDVLCIVDVSHQDSRGDLDSLVRTIVERLREA